MAVVAEDGVDEGVGGTYAPEVLGVEAVKYCAEVMGVMGVLCWRFVGG